MEKLFHYESKVPWHSGSEYENCVTKERMEKYPVSTKFEKIRPIPTMNYICVRLHGDRFFDTVHYEFKTQPFLKRNVN